MLLSLLVLLLLVTIFQPYLEMQMNWYLLKFKHWKYQMHSDFILKQADKHIKKSHFYLQRYNQAKAEEESLKAKNLLEKNHAMYEQINTLVEQFRDTYI